MSARQQLLAQAKEQGPCVCGAPYARHRPWDSIDESDATVWATAAEYAVSEREVRLVREAYADARRCHVNLPGRAAR
jgi:hypothetical protein